MIAGLDELLRLACVAEALCRKPGNVHPGASFGDLTVGDFLQSAEAASPWLGMAGKRGIGEAVEQAVAATRAIVGTNTNLGICLLLAPCAAADAARPFPEAIAATLDGLTVADACGAYRAIRIAAPGGLGQSAEQDVALEPTVTLLDAMRLAAGRDAIADQYAHGFRDVWELGVPSLASHHGGLEERVIVAHLRLMAALPDTLIARKCGRELARDSARRAQRVLDAGWPGPAAQPELAALDEWLRADGHRRNPGATADLVCASLFVAMRWRCLELAEVAAFCEARLADLPVRLRPEFAP
ncbi:MAG: triphosphoribosyl-dephospho-CoA synthase [Planctomyces sp.]|nr:triphosphoribosyl-dephospho-CoA synthase [Planctomyces sp.]